MSAFGVLAGRIDAWGAGRVGFAHGGELGAGVVEVAEGFAAEGGGAAGNSVDLDVGAETDICGERHGVCTFRIKISKIDGFRL